MPRILQKSRRVNGRTETSIAPADFKMNLQKLGDFAIFLGA